MSFDIAAIANADYIDAMYEKYKQDPNLVDEQWHAFFAGFDLGMQRDSAEMARDTPAKARLRKM